MIAISSRQITAFADERERLFVRRVALYLDDAAGPTEDPATDRRRAALVESGLRKAGEYDLASENAVARLIMIMHAYGEDFDGDRYDPDIKDILNRRHQNDVIRVDQIGRLLDEMSEDGIAPDR